MGATIKFQHRFHRMYTSSTPWSYQVPGEYSWSNPPHFKIACTQFCVTTPVYRHLGRCVAAPADASHSVTTSTTMQSWHRSQEHPRACQWPSSPTASCRSRASSVSTEDWSFVTDQDLEPPARVDEELSISDVTPIRDQLADLGSKIESISLTTSPPRNRTRPSSGAALTE